MHILQNNPRTNKRRVLRLAGAVLAIASAGTLVTDSHAQAADTSSVTMTLAVAPAIRSITVTSTGTGTYTNCTRNGVATGSTLSAPNGVCTAPAGLSVSLGEVASVVDVATSNMTATGATPWTPCNCLPGQDQFKLELLHPFGTANVAVLGTPTCDTASFGSPSTTCQTIAANTTVVPNLRITGPSVVSSNVTAAWSHVITWRAMPPAPGI